MSPPDHARLRAAILRRLAIVDALLARTTRRGATTPGGTHRTAATITITAGHPTDTPSDPGPVGSGAATAVQAPPTTASVGTAVARVELRRLADSWRHLLAGHEPDDGGTCRGCTGPARRRRWPCPVWRVAHQYLVGDRIGDRPAPARRRRRRLSAPFVRRATCT